MSLPTINILTEVKHLMPDSLMVLRVGNPGSLDPAQMQAHLVRVRDAVRGAQENGDFPQGKFVIMRDDITLDVLPEKLMNDLGWYRQSDAACLTPNQTP